VNLTDLGLPFLWWAYERTAAFQGYLWRWITVLDGDQ
jgi:hypothetical protein